MKKILVLYATREGQTEKVAHRIAAQLSAAGVDVQLANANNFDALASIDIERFDQLVFGASMHAGGLEKELVEFVNANRYAIELKPRSLFLVLLSAATKNPQLRADSLADARHKVGQQVQVVFDDIEMIAGALQYSQYSLPMKWMMRRIAKRAGEDTDISRDYEYTNWQQVEQYAQRLAAV